MKRMGWDDQMRDLKSIDQVHVLSGDVWRGWDGMIRPEILNQLTKFTYQLETDEEDGMGWSDRDIKNTKIRTSWRWMKRMGWDDKMRDLKPIDQDHVLPGDGWRWDGMIRWEILNQLTKFTYHLETNEEDGTGWSDRDFKNTKFTCILETDEEDGKGWSGQILNQLTKITYFLERDEVNGQMRDLKPIDQDHVLPRDGWRGWDGMIRWEILNQLTKFTYFLETDEEDGDDQMRDLKPIDKITYSLETDEEDEIWWSDERY